MKLVGINRDFCKDGDKSGIFWQGWVKMGIICKAMGKKIGIFLGEDGRKQILARMGEKGGFFGSMGAKRDFFVKMGENRESLQELRTK